MELQTARQIIDTLAQGIHPETGEAMPPDSPYNAPPVIRALFEVSRALESKPGRAPRQAPAKSGLPWAPQDDARLEAAYRAGADLKNLAAQFERTPFAVETRLAKLGLVAPRAGMRLPGSPAA